MGGKRTFAVRRTHFQIAGAHQLDGDPQSNSGIE